MNDSADVIVVGAGLAGLSCARALEDAGASVTVLERDAEPGGRVRTGMLDRCPIELGAHFLSRRYAAILRMVRAAGLEPELRELSGSYRTAVWRGGSPHVVDYGRPASVLGYSGLSRGSRLRLAAFALPLARTAPRARFFDLTTTASVDPIPPARLVGRDALRYLFAPASQAFCGYLPEELSLPFLTLGARFPLRRPLTVDGGLGRLPTAIAAGLDVRCGVTVESVTREGPEAVLVRARGADGGEHERRVRAVVLATTPAAALRIWPGAPPRERELLRGAGYTRYFLVYVRTRERAVPTAPGGGDLYMQVLPRYAYGGALSHVYYGGGSAAPDGGLVMAAAHSDSSAAEPDDEVLAARLLDEAERVHPGLREQTTATRAIRWHEKVPLFPPGRARELAAFRAAAAPGSVQLAGDYLYGPLMEAAALSGEAAARRVVEHLDGASRRGYQSRSDAIRAPSAIA